MNNEKENVDCFKVPLAPVKRVSGNSMKKKKSSTDFNFSNKRDYLSWDDYFMSVALLSAQRSKDPCTQVGAVIVNDQKIIVGMGYNGMPKHCDDDSMPWEKHNSNPLDNKYMYVCHAEVNAILNRNTSDVRECRIYSTLFPCNECAKSIIQSGIVEVIYLHEKTIPSPAMESSKRLFQNAKIKLRKLQSQQKQIVISWTDKAEIVN